jgi:hypothetical protein
MTHSLSTAADLSLVPGGPPAPRPLPVVTDPGYFYRLSVMTDKLRDTASLLLQLSVAEPVGSGVSDSGSGTAGPASEPLPRMLERYTRLRTGIADSLDAGGAAELLLWAPDLATDGLDGTPPLSYGSLLDAATCLGCLVDAILAAPAVVLGQSIARRKVTDVAEGLSKSDAALAAAAVTGATPNSRGGAYL